MNKFPFARGNCIFCTALVLAVSVNPANAETFRWGDSTASVQQRGGSHQSQSDVTRFKEGQRIITRDGNSTDITIQREKHYDPPRFDAEQRFGESSHRFDHPDLKRRYLRPETFDSDGSSSGTTETSQVRKLFLLRMMERFRWYFMPQP
jgi:hypothetical protein